MIFNKQDYANAASFILEYRVKAKKDPSTTDISRYCNISWDDAKLYSIIVNERKELNLYTDDELMAALNTKSAQLQKCRDTSRLLRKDVREFDRLPNALEVMNEELVKIMRSYKPVFQLGDTNKKGWFKDFASTLDKVGGIHIGDWHLNEIIQIIGLNSFDMETASKMVRKLIDYAKFKFLSIGINKVAVLATGDFLNSDRRYDEKIHMATNRTKATFIAFEIMRAMLIDLASRFDQVLFVGVTGNESRVDEELGWSELMMTDNYDYSIYGMLAYHFENHPKIHVPRQESYVEYPLNIAGNEILLTHGHQRVLSGGDVERGAINMVGKWTVRGRMIDHILFGHKHYSRAGDHFTRVASLPGANAYSDTALQLITKSAQMLHTFYSNKDIFTERVDLNNLDGIRPYPYNKDLEAYHAKSLLKTRPGTTIFQVRI